MPDASYHGKDESVELREFRATVRRFAETEILPRAAEAEASGQTPRELFSMLGELGWLGINLPESVGGGGADKRTEMVFIEELCRANAGIAGALMIQGGITAEIIAKYGSAEQQDTFLKPALAGERIACWALTEAEAGSDAAAIRTTARRDGDDYILDGYKVFITNAPIADFAVVHAKTRPQAGRKGMNVFLVETDRPGFECVRTLKKCGNRSSQVGELRLDSVRVPASAMLGEEEGTGMNMMKALMASGRVTYGARTTGVGQAAFEKTAAYVNERRLFGERLAQMQLTQSKLARMAMHLDIMRSYTHRVAGLYDQGLDVKAESSMVKVFCSEQLQAILFDAVQLHGGYGYIEEYGIEQLWRDGRLYTITEGANEALTLNMARVLGLVDRD
jgi:alkylation response protein AidB-like acyl-CoA dehydrogenase